MGLWFELTKFHKKIPVPSTRNPGMYLSFPFFGEWHLNIAGIYYSGSYMERFWRGSFREVAKRDYTPRSVLVLGQGIGSSFYAARRTWGDVTLTGVDIDPALVELGPRFYTPDYAHHTGIIHRRATMSIPTTVMRDALQYLKETTDTFDVIALDVFEGNGPAPLMGTVEFIHAVISRCTKGGYILVNVNMNHAMIEPWRAALPDLTVAHVQRNTVLIARRP